MSDTIIIILIVLLVLIILFVLIDLLFFDSKLIINTILNNKENEPVETKTTYNTVMKSDHNIKELPPNKSAAISTKEFELKLSTNLPENIKKFLHDPENKLFNSKIKYVNIFNCVDIIAVNDVPDTNILHVANVIAEWLDNNQDGIIDNSEVYYKLHGLTEKNKATIIIPMKKNDMQLISSIRLQYFRRSQSVSNDTIRIGGFLGEKIDSTIEQTLHLITRFGWCEAYPTLLYPNKDSLLGKAANKARGGLFYSVPQNYPDLAWYKSSDTTCNYECQIIEYLYFITITYLGGFDKKNWPALPEKNKKVWSLTTKKELENQDNDAYKILQNIDNYPLQKLPVGKYKIG